jgi:hypothetical protein
VSALLFLVTAGEIDRAVSTYRVEDRVPDTAPEWMDEYL